MFWVISSPAGNRLLRGTWLSMGFLAFLSICYFIFGDRLGRLVETSLTMGRDPSSTYTLSGRIGLWKECLKQAMVAPIMGHGYGSFVGAEGMLRISEKLGWAAPNPHNGYIEVLLDLGFIGVSAYLLILLLSLKNSYRAFLKSADAGHSFAFCILLLYGFAMMLLGFPTSVLLFFVLTYLSRYAFVLEHVSKQSIKSDFPTSI